MKLNKVQIVTFVFFSFLFLSLCGCSKEQPQGLESSDSGNDQTVVVEDICTNGKAHSWGNPSYTWADNNTACTASQYCAECGEVMEETANSVLSMDEKTGDAILNVTFEHEDFSSKQESAGNMADVEAAFVVSDGEGAPGEEVTLTLSVKNNPGIIAAGLELVYDRGMLELVNVADQKLLVDGTFSQNYGSDPYILTWNDALASDNTTEDGILAELTFKIKNGVSGSTEVSVGYCPSNVFDVELNNVSFRTEAGTVTVR